MRGTLRRCLAACAALAMMAVPCGMAEETPEGLLATMTLREKVGQLFVIRPQALSVDASGNRVSGGSQAVNEAMQSAYETYPAGGFCIFADNIVSPKQLKYFIECLKDLGRVEPIISVDEEGGRVLRVASNSQFGLEKTTNMAAIGKTGDVEQARQAGDYIGSYLAEYGFNLDFAPVADVLTNPKNAVIGNRSFGKDPQLVADMDAAFIDGLHRWSINACVKHFPGHGDTSGDTHKGLVAVKKTWRDLLTTELVPFMQNFDNTDAVMVAHISLENVTGSKYPASLSKTIITDLLRRELGYDGVVITDALEMGAIQEKLKSDEAAILAFEAGADLLLMPASYTRAFNGILSAVESGRISEERLNESVLRILRMKMGRRKAESGLIESGWPE